MAERELGYSEAPSEMFANNAGVIENGQGAQFTATIFMEEEDMTDFNGAKPVKTVRDNEFKIVLVDGASGESATNKLSILAAGDSLAGKFGVMVFGKDGSGNAVELPVGASGVVVEATDLDIRPLTNADVVTAEQGTSPWVVSATDLDIRDLVYTSDSVTAYQGTDPWIVSATDLDIRDLNSATDSVSAEITNTVTVQATDFDIRALTNADVVTVEQGTSPWVISDLSHSKDSVKVGDGTDFLAVNTDGSINVNVTLPGGKVCDYQTSATVGVNAEVLHMYPVTNGKLFIGNSLLVGARGSVKVRFGISNDGVALSTVKGVYFQDPKENRTHEIDCLELLGDGTKAIVIGITNLDAASSDVYSTLQGYEN